MSSIIYTSPIPSRPIHHHSVFTHLFNSSLDDANTIGGLPGTYPAFIDSVTGTTISRAQLKSLALSFGYGLRNHSAIRAKRGDTILIFSPNSIVWPVVIFGSVAAGLRCTLANTGYTANELAHQYSDSGARLLCTTPENLPTVREMLTSVFGISPKEADQRIILLPDGFQWAGGPPSPTKLGTEGLTAFEDVLSLGKLDQEEKFDGQQAHETVFLCYSSGTTGKPKGVETTHQNLTTVLDIVSTSFPSIETGQDIMLGILPFYHIYGAVKLLLFPFTCGVPTVVQARFDPEAFCANVQKYRITASLVVPPVLVVLSRHEAVDRYDLSTLWLLFSGAAPLGASLVKTVIDRLQSYRTSIARKLVILQGYGLTETSPTTHLLPAADCMRKVGSIGIMLPNLEARLVVDDTPVSEGGKGDVDARPAGSAPGQEQSEPGELWVRGPSVMKGYLNNVTATKNAITPDGWFKTGDIAIRDREGFYYIVDRRKELIKYKGFQVPPAELESVLLTHPDVADAAVIGVESTSEATELPRAYIVHAQPTRVPSPEAKVAFANEVGKWIESKVARHKFLRGGVVIIDIIPKSAAGKILRRELRERAKKELGGSDPALASNSGRNKAKL